MTAPDTGLESPGRPAGSRSPDGEPEGAGPPRPLSGADMRIWCEGAIDWVEDHPIIFLDGYDGAILGVSDEGLVVYSVKTIQLILMEMNDWLPSEADEWIDYNILGLAANPGYPIMVRTPE